MDHVKVFAPATLANLGPGFDILGLAVTGPGDIVEVRRVDTPGVIIEAIEGDEGRLTCDPTKNTAGVAAAKALELVGASQGVALRLYKGLPLGSGLGSSAASAAAAAWAVALLHDVEDKEAFLPACLAAEAAVSGYHADNVAPALLGGLVLVYGYHPLRLTSLPVPKDLHLAIVTPTFELPTAAARRVVPHQVALEKHVRNAGNLSAMITAAFRDDLVEFGQAMIDEIVEPARAHLIPGFTAVKRAVFDQGGLGCTIGGAGPTMFALCSTSETCERVGAAMQAAFQVAGHTSSLLVAKADMVGARLVPR